MGRKGDVILLEMVAGDFLIGDALVAPVRVCGGPLLRGAQVGAACAIGADGKARRPAFEVTALAGWAAGLTAPGQYQRFEFVSARATRVFVNGHRTVPSHRG